MRLAPRKRLATRARQHPSPGRRARQIGNCARGGEDARHRRAPGFARFQATMEAHVRKSDPAPARLEAIGRGYVTFARSHPDLFLLMFRSERLDFTRPALRSAADAALDVLAG